MLRSCRAWSSCVQKRNFASVAIIGGGTSGLSALKELKYEGYDVKLFENSSDVGGQWNLNNPNSNAWDGMYSNSSLDVWFYSDFPYIHDPNGTKSHYGTSQEIQKHMKQYAEYFKLYDNIQFNTTVNNAKPLKENDPTSDGWTIDYSFNGNDSQQENFDKIVICTGIFNKPLIPDELSNVLINGAYKGEIFNSQQIDNIDFENKRILVIGGGITGHEVAELACNKSAEKVYLNYRNKFFFIPFYIPNTNKNYSKNDFIHLCDVMTNRGPPLIDPTTLFDENQGLEEYGFYAPVKSFDQGFPRFNYHKTSVEHIKQNKLNGVYGELIDIDNSNNRQTLLFKDLNDDKSDDIKLDNIDIIIFTTGWDHTCSSSILSESIYNKMYDPNINPKRRLLYLNTFIPGYKQNNLAFIGQNVSLIQTGYELQARLISAAWSNRIDLADTTKQNEWVDNYYANDALPWFPAIASLPYMDEIAEIIGVLPNKNDFDDESIYERIQNERHFGTQYRLKGYGRNPLALPTLLNQLNTDAADNEMMRKQVILPEKHPILK